MYYLIIDIQYLKYLKYVLVIKPQVRVLLNNYKVVHIIANDVYFNYTIHSPMSVKHWHRSVQCHFTVNFVECHVQIVQAIRITTVDGRRF